MLYDFKGKREGALLLTGGKKYGNDGYFVEPTVFADDMEICRKEIFGPVMQILKFNTIDEVIERANNNHYGLAASTFKKNIDIASRISNNLRADTVWIKCYYAFDPSCPFGGK